MCVVCYPPPYQQFLPRRLVSVQDRLYKEWPACPLFSGPSSSLEPTCFPCITSIPIPSSDIFFSFHLLSFDTQSSWRGHLIVVLFDTSSLQHSLSFPHLCIEQCRKNTAQAEAQLITNSAQPLPPQQRNTHQFTRAPRKTPTTRTRTHSPCHNNHTPSNPTPQPAMLKADRSNIHCPTPYTHNLLHKHRPPHPYPQYAPHPAHGHRPMTKH